MTQQGHEALMESGTPADEAVTVTTPPSLRRDSVEDADSSLTRKRPRLDNGLAQVHTMTACARPSTSPPPSASPSAHANASHTEPRVEMTIRSQLPSSSQPTATRGSPVPAPNHSITDPDAMTDQDASTSTPPVIAIESDDEEPAALPDVAADDTPAAFDAEAYFGEFPFAATHGQGDYGHALVQITTHVHSAPHLDGTVIPEITNWLSHLPDHESQWGAVYLSRSQFWRDFAAFGFKLLTRRTPFGDHFSNGDQSELEMIYRFLKSYISLCVRLIQVDASAIAHSSQAKLSEEDLLSPVFLYHLTYILRVDLRFEKFPLFTVLASEYGANIQQLASRLTANFVTAPINGVEHLLALTNVAYDKVTPKPLIVPCATHVLGSVVWYLEGRRSQYNDAILHYFKTYSAELEAPEADSAVLKELVHSFQTLLSNLCHCDKTIASELAEQLLPPSEPHTAPQTGDRPNGHVSYRDDVEDRHVLISHSWKFKLLMKYVTKGRMDLRILGIGMMDSTLVELWNVYNTSSSGIRHPVMQFMADYLIDEKIIDYIMSVDSHPQLISNSGNIVGFLVVTHRYTKRHADSIWQMVSNSRDPRVATATIAMIRRILPLMEKDEVLYLCSKLYSLPIESCTQEVLRLLAEIFTKLQEQHIDYGSNVMRPWTVCIRIMQDTSPSQHSTASTLDLHRRACTQLDSMAGSILQEERHRIYRECSNIIADRSSKATGAIRAIHLLCAKYGPVDMRFFPQHPDMLRGILEELCAFVRAGNTMDHYGLYCTALDYRLDLLTLFILEIPGAIPEDLYFDIWHHTIGEHALNNDIRDRAWSRFTRVVKRRQRNDFCNQLIAMCVPKLEPDTFTPGLYEFVEAYRFPTSMRPTTAGEGDSEAIQIPEADLLWRMMMIAPRGTIESRSAELLVRRYADVDMSRGANIENLEEAHVVLAKKCIRELLTNCTILRHSRVEVAGTTSEDNMDILVSDNSYQKAEMRFSRTVLFTKLLLEELGSKPGFARRQVLESTPPLIEPQMNCGDDIELTYTASSSTDKKRLVIGTENSVQELEARLCSVTGFSKVNIFFLGRQLNTSAHLQEQMKACGLDRSTHMLVQDASGGETQYPISEGGTGCSIFELTILEHFDELFSCMDSADYTSEMLFGLLERLSPPDSVSNDVAEGNNCIFTPGKPFQAEYAAYALRERLEHQLRKGALDKKFLLNAVQLLHGAILNPGLLSDSLSGAYEMRLASVLVRTLLQFLKERPGEVISSRYFSQESVFVGRLSHLLIAALDTPSDHTPLISNSYAVILEASLHSNVIWKIFMSRPDSLQLHQKLLLHDPRKILRDNIVTSIASVCGGDLPITSSVTVAETAAGFWKIVSAILPEVIQYHGQAEQLLTLAEQLFRGYDEHFRNEQSLRGLLSSWGELLLQHRHEEVVGRGEVDTVVLGLTKLLLSCVASLKSFKKPLNAGLLMRSIFEKFLFTPKVLEVDAVRTADHGMTVLDSGTRRELYDLVHALADDRAGIDLLLDSAGELVNDNESRAVGFDRKDIIRSPTGYVGLVNPRFICYMNALLTQLFMNINFRKFILGLTVADPGGSQRLLFEFQSLFARMQNSFRKAADPRGFAACIKGIDGLPIDLCVQMDVDEFYNLLFDQLEGQLLNSSAKQQFRSFYGGQTINQIKSKECQHVSERVEPFFVVQCDVAGKANLQESLQAFVEGDVMEGENKYKCESCGGKFVDAVKRTCLKDVPDHLIFHLKRFDFDLMTMERTKINDLFQFPEEIDVSAYHVDYLSDTSKARREDIFELVGILVHHGTSENGHYYSYIRERPAQVGSAPSWVEFNDREVDAFDPSQIPWQTFGGLQDLRDPHQQKAYSAYMVFYQRKQAIEQDQKEYIRPSQREPPKVPLPPGFYEEISADNDQVVHEYCLHDSEHSKFVRHLLASLRTINNGNCSDDHQQEGKGIRMALAHLCYIIAREREIEYFKEFFDQLRKSLLACVSCCQIGIEWLSTQQTALTITLLRCLHPDVRSEMRVLLVDCLHFLRKEEPTLYYGTDSDMDTATRTPTQGILADLVRQLKVVMHESWSSSRGWEDFHSTLCQIADMGHIEVALLLAHGFLDDALTIFGIHAHAGLRANHPDIWRIMEKKKLGLNSLAELVCLLTSHMDIRTIEDRSPQSYDRLQQYTRSHYTFPVTQSEFFLLCLWDEPNKALAALDKMIETYDFTRNDVFYPGEFLKWMLRTRDQRFQCMLFETVFEGITQLQHPFCDPYVRTAIPYCEACGNPTFASQVIDTALKKASVLRTVEDESWQALLGFVDALPTLESPALRLMGRLPAGFYRQILMRSRTYGPTLLLHDNRNARNATWRHLDRLFNLTERPEYISVETLTAKYTAVRYMLHELLERFRSEQRNRTLRSHLEPLIRTCDMLAGQLKLLYEEDDDTLIEFRHEGDERLLIQHFQEMVSLLTLLPDEESPSSSGDQLARRGSEASSTTAEPAELALDSWQASEFGSESEELDNLEPSVEPTSR